MTEVIHIQICRTYKAYKKGSLNLDIGDIQGSIGIYGATRKEVLNDIGHEIDKLLAKKGKEKGHDRRWRSAGITGEGRPKNEAT